MKVPQLIDTARALVAGDKGLLATQLKWKHLSQVFRGLVQPATE